MLRKTTFGISTMPQVVFGCRLQSAEGGLVDGCDQAAKLETSGRRLQVLSSISRVRHRDWQ